MPGDLVAADPTVLHHDVARTVKGGFRRYHALLQTRRCRNDLKGRSRLIGVTDAAVTPHLIEQLLFLFFTHSFACLSQIIGMIQVEFRDIHHRIKLSVLGIDDNDRYPFCFFGFHHLSGELGRIALDVPVHADIQVLPRNGLYTLFSLCGKLHAPCIGHGENCALRSLQYLFIFHFQTDDSLIVTAGKSQYLGSQRIIWVIPLIVFIHLYSGKIIAPDPVSDFLFHIALYLFNRGILLYPLTDIFLRQIQFPA